MQVRSHGRWYLLLALAGALLVERLPWEFVVFLVAMVLAERFTRILRRRRREWHTPRDRVVAPEAPLARRAKRRLPITLTRLLGVECSSCRGHGCETCAYTGLD